MEVNAGPRKMDMDMHEVTSRAPAGRTASFSEFFSTQTQHFIQLMSMYFLEAIHTGVL